MKRFYGYIKTDNLESYKEYNPEVCELPKEYKLKDLGEVWDQGSKGSCVSCSISEMYNFYQISHGRKLDIPYTYVYDKRSDKSLDGMQPAEGFKILSDEGRIKMFSRISTLNSLKQSILANGPALIAMTVRDTDRTDFWNGPTAQNIGHAVAVVGYNQDSLIIKNSWGYSYGEYGYWYLPFNDFQVVKEAWTIIK